MEVVKNHALIVIVIILWTSISDPECAVGGCRGSAAGEERDPEHGSTSSATSRASVSGSEPHRDPAVRTARNRENTAGQSCGHGMFHDLPQVRTFHQLSVVLPEACSDVGLWRLRLINVCWKLMFLFVCCCSVKGPELINMYVGQSEENIREGLCPFFNPLIVLCVPIPNN